MPTRRERMRTSLSSILGLCTWVTTGFLGSSKMSAFMVTSRMFASSHSFHLAAQSRREDGLEQSDIVDQLIGGDRIGLSPTHGPGEGDEIVLHRLRRGNFRRQDRAAAIGRGDDPARRRLDMRLVTDVYPALGAVDREAGHEGIGERGGYIRRASSPELDVSRH